MDTSLLIWSVVFSSIGLGLFIYGKKQKAVVPLFSGLGLMIYTISFPIHCCSSQLALHSWHCLALSEYRPAWIL